MTLMIHFTTQYDAVIATITINQLRTPDRTVGHHLLVRAMYSLLVTLTLRIPLRDVNDERWNRGLSSLRKVLSQKCPHEVVVALKSLRRFYRRLTEDQRRNLYREYLDTVVEVVMSQLTEDASDYAIKPYLKTLVLLHRSLPEISLETAQRIESIWRKHDNVEIRYWIARLCLSILIIEEEEEEEGKEADVEKANAIRSICERIISETIENIDITLSYRSMLADLCLLLDEVDSLSPRLKALFVFLSLWNLEDSNRSIQETILRLNFVKKDRHCFAPGVSQTREILLQFSSEEAVCKEYANIASRVLCRFVERNMPADLTKEMRDVRFLLVGNR